MTALLVAAAVAYPNGYKWDCNNKGPTEPVGFAGNRDQALHANITCTNLNCTLTADQPFKGFVISSSAADLLPRDSDATQTFGGRCLTHTSRRLKNTLAFAATNSTMLWATVVTQKPGRHNYNVVGPVLARAPVTKVYIVGAGPGGLAAARYAASLNLSVTVFERGGSPPPGFYSQPIKHTEYHSINSTYMYSPLGPNTSYKLVQMVGGNQAVNGAVFAPGLAKDLADSVGVTVDSAKAAQMLTASYVHHVNATVEGAATRPIGLMQQCINNSACDHTYAAAYATTVARRSIAYELPPEISVLVNSTATLVTDTEIKFRGNESVFIQPDDVVIIAAGALTSPQLIGITQFTGFNHYYKVSTLPAFNFTNAQRFFHPDADWEHNIARGPGGVIMNITMRMNTAAMPEHHTYGQDYVLPDGAAGSTQAWHYMGTVPHVGFMAPNRTRVFVGDASALLKPFHCHTSMPAAAAGVLSVQAALGTLELAPVADDNKHKGYDKGGFIFAFTAGVAAITLGVAAHAVPTLKRWHYVLTPFGVLLIVAAALRALYVRTHHHGGRSALPSKFQYHRYLGVVVIFWLIAQSVVGAGVHIANDRLQKQTPSPTLIEWRKRHRASGALLLVLIGVMATHIGFNEEALYVYENADATLPLAQTAGVLALTTAALIFYRTCLWWPAPNAATGGGESLL